jgi:subtilisin family serine protease
MRYVTQSTMQLSGFDSFFQRTRNRQRGLSIRWLVVLLFMIGAQAITESAVAQTATESKPVQVLNENVPDAIPNQYIIVFKHGTSREAVLATQNLVKQLDGTIKFTYSTALIGFSAKLPLDALKVLRTDSNIDFIEADQKVSLFTVQTNPPTGLDRTSERILPLDSRYTYSETGSGVHAYIIDSGIRATHNDFVGRVGAGTDLVLDGNGTNDCYNLSNPHNSHGTMVAGIVGGTQYGIARHVTLHPVRIADCNGNIASNAVAIAAVDWVTANAIHPAVANMSLGVCCSPSLDSAVSTSIGTGITYVAAAGNAGLDACGLSPASVSAVIAVGSINPTNDTRMIADPNGGTSGIGSCVDLFAPGVSILSAYNLQNISQGTGSGTSFAAPHVAGVAALYLQNHTAATPAEVWNAIHNADNVSTTPGWMGVINPGLNSPNELLHWGSLNSGMNDGDPHITTVDGVHYDFQGAGEYVSLRDHDGTEIQTRQTPIATTFNPGPNPYTGLATCVSLNTAVAARVGTHRVTYEPNISGKPDPSGLQLRVDGNLVALSANGLDLGSGGRVLPTPVGGIDIYFPNETILNVTPGWWASQNQWYLNVDVLRTRSDAGLMGVIASGSWLPAMPDGTSIGSMPVALHQRYVDLYDKFGDAWRVTEKTSLFDYAPGTSTSTFTLNSWPQENPPCTLAEAKPVKPTTTKRAELACRAVNDKHADCVFDVKVTGNAGFAKTYLASQKMRVGSIRVDITGDHDTSEVGEPAVFTATVMRNLLMAGEVPTGYVQFMLDGSKGGELVKLDSHGRAIWNTSRLNVGSHRVRASYIPARESVFLAGKSIEMIHTVVCSGCGRVHRVN